MRFCTCGKTLLNGKDEIKTGIFRCSKCSRNYYVCDDQLHELNVEEHLKIDIMEILKKNCNKEFNEAQKEAYEEYFKKVKKGIISLPTGTGKTLLAACILRNLFKQGMIKINEGEHVLILAPRRVILEQIADPDSDFQNMFKDLPIPIVRIDDNDSASLSERMINELKKQDTQIVVATPQLIHYMCSAISDINRPKKIDTVSPPLEVFSKVKMVIFDEVHHTYNGPNISKSLKQLIERCDFVLGLSATPTKESKDNIGDILFYYPIDAAMQKGILIPKIKFYRYDTKVHNLSNEYKDVWRVAIENRAKKYAEEVINVIEKECKGLEEQRILKTAIACPNITEANLLYDVLKSRLGKDPVYLVHSRASDPMGELDKFRRSDEGILISVNMVDIGFDDKELELLVLAKQLKNPISYFQLKGRVLRKPTNYWNIKYKHEYAIIIDFVDNYTQHERYYDKVIQGMINAANLESDFSEASEVRIETKARVIVKSKGVTLLDSRTKVTLLDSTVLKSPKEEKVVEVAESFNAEDIVKTICKYLREGNDVIIKIKGIDPALDTMFRGDKIIEAVKEKISPKTLKVKPSEWKFMQNDGVYWFFKILST